MTKSDQYTAFVLSRLFAGIFGSVPSILGPSAITDLFFLHERGRAFAVFHISFLLGTVAGPTFGGFIVEHVHWTVEFWWTVGLQGLMAVLVFLFLEETGYSRAEKLTYVPSHGSWLSKKVSTFLPGNKVVRTRSLSEIVRAIPLYLIFQTC